MERGLRGGRDLSESIDRCYTLQSKKLMLNADRDRKHATATVSPTGGRVRQKSPRKRRVKSENPTMTQPANTTADATVVAEKEAAAANDDDDDDATLRKRRMRDDDDGNETAAAGVDRVERLAPNAHKRLRSDTLRDVMFQVCNGACMLRKRGVL